MISGHEKYRPIIAHTYDAKSLISIDSIVCIQQTGTITFIVTLFSTKSGRYLKFHRITNTHDTHLPPKLTANHPAN